MSWNKAVSKSAVIEFLEVNIDNIERLRSISAVTDIFAMGRAVRGLLKDANGVDASFSHRDIIYKSAGYYWAMDKESFYEKFILL